MLCHRIKKGACKTAYSEVTLSTDLPLVNKLPTDPDFWDGAHDLLDQYVEAIITATGGSITSSKEPSSTRGNEFQVSFADNGFYVKLYVLRGSSSPYSISLYTSVYATDKNRQIIGENSTSIHNIQGCTLRLFYNENGAYICYKYTTSFTSMFSVHVDTNDAWWLCVGYNVYHPTISQSYKTSYNDRISSKMQTGELVLVPAYVILDNIIIASLVDMYICSAAGPTAYTNMVSDDEQYAYLLNNMLFKHV